MTATASRSSEFALASRDPEMAETGPLGYVPVRLCANESQFGRLKRPANLSSELWSPRSFLGPT